MAKVVVMDHPLIQHKIGIMRRQDTGSKEFRTLVSEVAMLECYEATRDLELRDVEIETPICKATVKELKGKKLAVVPILRAGLGMVEGMLEMIPAAKVGHIGYTVILRPRNRLSITVSFRLTAQTVRYLLLTRCWQPADPQWQHSRCSRTKALRISVSCALLQLRKV